MKQYDAQLDSVDGWPAPAPAAAAAATSTASSAGDPTRDSSSPVDATRDLDQDAAGARRQIAVEPVQDHFFGTSSPAVLIQSALELKKKVTGNDGGATTSTLVSPSGQKMEVTDANPVSVPFFFGLVVVMIHS